MIGAGCWRSSSPAALGLADVVCCSELIPASSMVPEPRLSITYERTWRSFTHLFRKTRKYKEKPRLQALCTYRLVTLVFRVKVIFFYYLFVFFCSNHLSLKCENGLAVNCVGCSSDRINAIHKINLLIKQMGPSRYIPENSLISIYMINPFTVKETTSLAACQAFWNCNFVAVLFLWWSFC